MVVITHLNVLRRTDRPIEPSETKGEGRGIELHVLETIKGQKKEL